MNQNDHGRLLSTLLRQDASQVKGWVKNSLSGDQRAPDRFNWLGLAEGAAFKARQEPVDSAATSRLEWAQVATMIYEDLADEADDYHKESLLCSSMMLRAFMILKLGMVSQDSVLDLETITHWFFEGLDLSPEVAAQKALHWQELPLENVQALRKIKNRLAVIDLLSQHEAIRQNQEIQSWLSLRNKLP